MQITVEWRQEEENAWEETAAAADNGRGIELQSVNLNSETDMQEIYDALAVKGPGPKSRLRAYMQRLQTPKPASPQQQQNGTLRRCFCIRVLVFYSASRHIEYSSFGADRH